jgi:hypothetical protein
MGDVDRGEDDTAEFDPHDSIDWMEDGDDSGACPVCGGRVVHDTVEITDLSGRIIRTHVATYCEGARDDGAGCGWIA